MPGMNDDAGEHAEVGADVVQHDHNDHDAGEQCEGGSWVALKDAAALLGVSVDTVKRRMQRGEIESRRETIPQGFRWLVFVESAKNDAPGSILSPANDNQDIDLPRDAPDIVAALLRELEGRHQEIARLHDVIASQARALEHAGEQMVQLTATVEGAEGAGRDETGDQAEPPEPDDETSQAGIWTRLRRWWQG